MKRNKNLQSMVERSSLNFSIQNFDHGCYYHTYMTSSAKTTMFTLQLNLILLPQPTQWLLIPSVSSIMLHINWSASLEVILPNLQSHDWNNGANRGCQLGT